MSMRATQNELAGDIGQTFNLAGECGVDPERVIRERLEAPRRERQRHGSTSTKCSARLSSALDSSPWRSESLRRLQLAPGTCWAPAGPKDMGCQDARISHAAGPRNDFEGEDGQGTRQPWLLYGYFLRIVFEGHQPTLRAGNCKTKKSRIIEIISVKPGLNRCFRWGF
jgi:hypothetical protein